MLPCLAEVALTYHVSSQAKDKLAILDKAKARRIEVLTQDGLNPYKSGAPGIVDVRVWLLNGPERHNRPTNYKFSVMLLKSICWDM